MPRCYRCGGGFYSPYASIEVELPTGIVHVHESCYWSDTPRSTK